MRLCLLLFVKGAFMFEPNEEDFRKAAAQFEKGDYEEVFPFYEGLAKNGNVEAQTLVGWLYQNGFGIAKNEEEASNWFKRASNNGSVEAEFNLGKMAAGKRNYNEAFQYYLSSANRGYAPALFRLGWIYENGRALPVDIERAIFYYKKSADGGNVFGKKGLALLFLQGRAGRLRVVLGAFLFMQAILMSLYISISDPYSDRLRD